MSKAIQNAMRDLTKALMEDPEYAYGWHANIAACVYDECDFDEQDYHIHQLGNAAASRFMKLCFGVETSQYMLKDNTTVTPEILLDKDKLTAAEAVYGFAAYLTSREKSITLSAHNNASPVVDLVVDFLAVNSLGDPRDNYADYLIHPKS